MTGISRVQTLYMDSFPDDPLQKQDPTRFLQVHARPVKIHIDPQIAQLADAPNTM